MASSFDQNVGSVSITVAAPSRVYARNVSLAEIRLEILFPGEFGLFGLN